MTRRIIFFINMMMAGLLAGTLSGIWLGYDPMTLSAPAYLEQQQAAIKALNTIMPFWGLITIVLTLISAWLQKANRTIFIILLTAAVLLIIGGLVTRLGINPSTRS